MNGFSTLNRFLGKKSKSQAISKSTSNLSTSSIRPLSQYDTSATPLSSQLETTNSIVSQSNTPFEQTFRITVHLPKGQLYVARLGAKTKLLQLLLQVCENKQLDPTKYELRHPGDSSQAFNLEQTVGAVGLSEIRLCYKSEPYNNFNANEILTLRNAVGRDSLSSSELSSRNSKHTLKTASPYSSTNSLASSDSTGMNNYRGPHSLQTNIQQRPPIAPARKKRAAPRPPSQCSIALSNGNGTIESTQEQKDEQEVSTPEPEPSSPLTRKEFHVSSPNLTHCSEMSLLRTAEFHKSNVSVDCNGNSRNSRDNNSLSNGSSSGHLHCNGSGAEESRASLSPTLSANTRPVSMSVLNNEILYQEKELNGNRELYINGGSVADLSHGKQMPEPAPRKRMVAAKKKAPAPPPRGIQPIATPRNSATSTISTPEAIAEVSQIEEDSTTSSVPNESPIEIAITKPTNIYNGKSRIPVTPPTTPESIPASPQIISKEVVEGERRRVEGELTENIAIKEQKIAEPLTKLTNGHVQEKSKTNDIYAHSKQNSSDQSPPPTPATPTSHTQLESKLSSGTSSDDDDHIKVYNIKLGKTIVQPIAAYESNAESTENKPRNGNASPKSLHSLSVHTESASSPVSTMSPTSPQRPESPEWSYTIPAPPTFADNETVAATYRSEGSDRTSPTNRSLLSDRDDSLTIASDTHNEIAITSDIEDGYRGGGSKKLETPAAPSPQPMSTVIITTEKPKTEVVLNNVYRTNSVSPPRSPLETKAEVITQLNSVINGEGGNDVGINIKRTVDTAGDKKIESAKPSELTNFTIQSYTKVNPIENDRKEEPNQTTVPDGMSNSNQISEENTSYIRSTKRPSLTLSNSIVGQATRQRSTNVARSDSFHSTRVETRLEPGDLSQSRSTSQVSLNTIQKQTSLAERFLDTNGRKSSSELSIGETPSLQSLIVIKSILDSRKNSLTNGNSDSKTDFRAPEILETIPALPKTPAPPLEVRNTTVIETISTVYRRPSLKDFVSVSGENVTNADTFERKTTHVNVSSFNPNVRNGHTDCTNTSLIETRTNELRMPMNQLKTPSPEERSKDAEPGRSTSSNIISSDCDSSKENSPKNKIISQINIEAKPLQNSAPEPAERIYRYQGPPSINLSTWSERPKSQVSIKSDNDYIFGIGTAKARLSLINNESKPEKQNGEAPKAPMKAVFARNIEYKKAASMVETPRPQTPPHLERRPSIEIAVAPIHVTSTRPLSVNNSLLLGRAIPKMGPKSNFMPVVKGFKSLEPVTQPEAMGAETSKDHEICETVVPTQRPATIVRSNSAVSTNILRFSTGSSSLQTVPINITNKEPSPPPTQPPTPAAPFFSQVALRKTGLKEKILASGDNNDSPNKPRSTRPLSEQQNCAKLEMKLTTTSSSVRSSAPLVVPDIPPPPPPIIRSVVTKQNSLGKSACIPDTRDQLLSAIRNFSKDSLKRS